MSKELFRFGAWIVRMALNYAVQDKQKRGEIIEAAQELADEIELFLVEVKNMDAPKVE